MTYNLLISLVLLTIASTEEVSIHSWRFVNDTAPLNDSHQIIGYNYDDSEIVIVGGENFDTQVSDFDGDSEKYISYEVNDSIIAASRFVVTVEGAGEGYFQVPGEDLIYFIEYNISADMDELLSYDTVTGDIALVSTYNESLNRPCVCVDPDGGADGYIYVAGILRGTDNDGRVHRYNRDNDHWIKTWSGMDEAKHSMACAIYNSDLYLFGGVRDESNVLSSDIMLCPGDGSNACSTSGVDSTLSAARMGIQAVTIDDLFDGRYVVLIGGIDSYGSRRATNIVEIFDMDNTSRIMTVASLNRDRKYHTAAYDSTNSKIFVFAGQNNNEVDLNDIEVTEVVIPTSNPTFDPTMDPTMEPTMDPTMDPTTDPTRDPTMDPTTDPTMDPTAPSSDPTSDPTTEPTEVPTNDPTEPTLEPTRDPTMEPSQSKTPTESPSPDPTEAPSEEYSPSHETYDTDITVYVLLIVVLVIICCLIALCLWYYNKEEEKRQASAPPPVIVAAVAIGGCYKCGNNDCSGNDCGQSCLKCGDGGCDGVNCGEVCNNCGETTCNSQQCYGK